MLVQPDELGSTSKEHQGAAALKTEMANSKRVTWTPGIRCHLCGVFLR